MAPHASAATEAAFGRAPARPGSLRAPRHRTRRRRSRSERIPWPGDVTRDALILPSLEDVPVWINGPRSRLRKILGLAVAATLSANVSLLIMQLAQAG